MGVAIGLLGLGLQWMYPDQKWAGKWVAIGGVVILFAAVIAYLSRWHTIREYERMPGRTPLTVPPVQTMTQTANPHNEFKPHNENVFTPRIDVHVPVSQSQGVRAKPERTRDPVFECRSTRFLRYGFDTRNGQLIREDCDVDPSQVYDYIKFVNTGLAKFLYVPEPGVDPRLVVSAHVFIYINKALDQVTPEELRAWSAKEQSRDVYQPVWDEDEPYPSIEFLAGRTHELIIGLVPAEDKPRGFIGYEYGKKRNPFADEYVLMNKSIFSPELHNIQGQRFFIRVELIPKLWSEVRCKLPSFWFQLSFDSEHPVLTFLGTAES